MSSLFYILPFRHASFPFIKRGGVTDRAGNPIETYVAATLGSWVQTDGPDKADEALSRMAAESLLGRARVAATAAGYAPRKMSVYFDGRFTNCVGSAGHVVLLVYGKRRALPVGLYYYGEPRQQTYKPWSLLTFLPNDQLRSGSLFRMAALAKLG
jgi:hypothetical protein